MLPYNLAQDENLSLICEQLWIRDVHEARNLSSSNMRFQWNKNYHLQATICYMYSFCTHTFLK